MVLIHLLMAWIAKGRTSELEDIYTSHTHTHTQTHTHLLHLGILCSNYTKLTTKIKLRNQKWGLGGMEIPQPIEK